MKTKLLLVFMTLSLTLGAINAQNQSKPKVYVECQVREFNRADKSFTIRLSNQLREQGWIILKSPAKADYRLTVNAETRKYSAHVTKEETTYTTRKFRDTVLVIEGNAVDFNMDSIAVKTNRQSLQGNAISAESNQTQTIVSRDRYATEEHKTPVSAIYFVYMDAQIQLSNKNGEVIYEDVLDTKEGHTQNYEEAARAAATKTIKKIATILPTKIKK